MGKSSAGRQPETAQHLICPAHKPRNNPSLMAHHAARLVALLLMLNTATSLAATLKLEVIPLQNRTAQEIIPIIEPLIADGGSVTGMNYQLIVKTTSANLEEIKQLLNSIDKPARRLMITVTQDIGADSGRDEHSLSGKYRSGDAAISAGDGRPSNAGVSVSTEDNKGDNIKYRSQSTRLSMDDNNSFRVMTLEGQPAFIQSGQSVPVASQQTYAGPRGVVVQDRIEYRDVTSGFYVLPRLNADNVTLLISPNMSRSHSHDGAGFSIQNVETTVSGRLGDWIRVGGINQEFRNNQQGTLYSSRGHRQARSHIMIKVEEIR